VGKKLQKITHFLEFHGSPDISMPDVSSFIGMLEEFFNEDYTDANKIQAKSFQMRGKLKEWWI
jgi:hypothetical protein